MKALNSYLKAVDILGSQYALTYRGESRVKTFLGSCMTILLAILFVTATILLGQDIVLRSKPKVTRTQRFSREDQIELMSLKPLIAFANPDGTVIEKDSDLMKSLEVLVELYEIRVREPSRVLVYPVQPCNAELLGEDASRFQESYSKIENFLCINPKMAINAKTREPVLDYPPTFMAEYGYAVSNTVQIKVKACNEKLKPGCRKGLEATSTFFITVQNQISYLSLTDYDDPFTTFYRSVTAQISKDLYQRDFLKFTKNSVFTDEGFIFEDLRKEDFVTFDSTSKQTLFYNDTDRNLYGMNYTVSFLFDEYSREYLKVQQLAAELGGFMKACWTVIALFMKFYCRYAFYSETEANSQVTRFTVNHRQNSSATKINIREKEEKKEKVGFFKFLVALVSKNKRIKYQIDEKQKLKVFDAEEIEMRLKKLEAMREEENNG